MTDAPATADAGTNRRVVERRRTVGAVFVLLVTVGVIGLAWWTIGNPQRSAEKACRNEINDTYAESVESLIDHPSPAQHFMGPVPPGDLLSYHPGRGKLFKVTGTIDVDHGNNM